MPQPGPPSRRQRGRVAAILRTETAGGALLVIAAVVAVILANSPAAHLYQAVRDWHVGPTALGLHLSVAEWTADGLLTLFFFLVGLELKYEFVRGELRDLRQAVVPVAAAVGGMAVPAAVYFAWNPAGDDSAGWAIPTATDIAFALAVLAVVGRHLPGRLRTFLLTLAVVDDLLAIIVIAVFFARDIRLLPLLGALAAIALFAVLIQRLRHITTVRYLFLPALAALAWGLMLTSGVHATIAGVLIGFTVPVLGRRLRPALPTPAGDAPDAGQEPTPGTAGREPAPRISRRLDEALRPLSAGVAVPLFAFFSAGVTVGGLHGLADALSSGVALGVITGLVLGKTIGIFGTTMLVGRLVRSPFTRRTPAVDVLALAMIGGVGFTVSLLIGQLAFAGDAARTADAQVGVLLGSALAAVLAGVLLSLRSRRYRVMGETATQR